MSLILYGVVCFITIIFAMVIWRRNTFVLFAGTLALLALGLWFTIFYSRNHIRNQTAQPLTPPPQIAQAQAQADRLRYEPDPIKQRQGLETLVGALERQPDPLSVYAAGTLVENGLPPADNTQGVPPNPRRAVFYFNRVGTMGLPIGHLRAAHILRRGFPNVMPPDEAAAERALVAFQRAQDVVTPPPETIGEMFFQNLDQDLQELERAFMGGRNFVPLAHQVGAQNVHDHAVGSATNQIIAHMERNRAGTGEALHTGSAALSALRALVDDPRVVVTEDQRERARRALNTVRRENRRDDRTQRTELEMLALVNADLQRLFATLPAEEAANAKATAVKQLAEAVEFGETVCPKGRFGHLAAITQGIDADVPPILSDDQLIEYVRSKISATRDEVLAEWGPDKTARYEASEEAEEKEMRDIVRRRLHREFVEESDLMTDMVFSIKVNPDINIL